MMGELGYSVVNVGANDLLYGIETLKNHAKKNHFKLVTSNIVEKSSGKNIFDPFAIEEIAGVKVAFLGVVRENVSLTSMTKDVDDLEVLDVEETLQDLIPKVRKKADLVVLFANIGNKQTQQLVDEVGGVDIAISGGDAFVNQQVVEVGNEEVGQSLVCAAGDRGKYIAALNVVVSKDGKILRYTNDLHGLDKNIADEPGMLAKVEAFKAELREVKKREAVEQVVGDNNPQKGPQERFLGANTCSRCHEAEYNAWHSSAHAHSLASLEGKSMETSAECLQCHVTGHQEVNGYAMNRSELGNISCEQCHGQGTLHGTEHFKGKPGAESCLVCHDKKNSPNFDFDSYWKAIAH